MTTDSDMTRIVRSWLDEGATVLPERVLDDVLGQIPSIPQDRSIRWLPLSGRIRVDRVRILGIAASLIALIVAVRLLSPVGSVGPGAHPSPPVSPSPSPSPAPSPLAVPAEGPMEGTYRFDNVDGTGIQVTFTVPSGWDSCCGGWPEKGGTTPPGGVAFQPWHIQDIYRDPCNRSAGPTRIGPKVADLIAAVRAQPDRRPTKPTATTVDGYSGQEIEWSVPSNADFSKCTKGTFVSWYGGTDPNSERYHQGGDQVDHLWVLDIDGTTLTLMTTFFPGTSPADRAELDGIMSSIRIDTVPSTPRPEPTPSL